MRKGDPYSVRSVQRAMNLLDHLGDAGELSVTGLSNATGLHKSTVHRLLMTLEMGQFVRQNPINGHYRLGWKLMALGAAVTRSIELRAAVHPYLEKLANVTGCTVHLGILDRDTVLYIDKIDTEGSFRLFSQIGRHAPVHCTALGKVLVAYLPRLEQERIVGDKPLRRYTKRTIVEPDCILQHLQQVARQGYAVDDGEHEDLIHCFAAPVRDNVGKVIAAISVTTVSVDLLATDRERLLDEVRKTAASISFDPP